MDDHGSIAIRRALDQETISKTADLKKKSDFEAIGLSSASSSSTVETKREIFVEKKQLQSAEVRIKVLQYQALKVSTDLDVKARDKTTRVSKELQQDHDQLDVKIKIFNDFATSVTVAIGEIDGSEGEHHISHVF